ncbi:MAG TPA: hypothetical protein VFM54_09295 [Micromonosporaceae bacterium]|nr:hypothetical protein [Micromonosporaceae bacterium]
MTDPPAMVRVPAGTTLRLPEGAWRGHGELVLRVGRVMHELDRHVDPGWVQLEGTRLDGEGRRAGHIQACVRVDALEAATRR